VSEQTETQPSLRAVVGLGNPGAKYEGTRHNVGFEALDAIAKNTLAPERRSKFDGLYSSTTVGTTKLILIWPLTYMNNSGRCVKAFADFFKLDVKQNLAVVCDDLSLPTGKLRIRPKGSAGGQKGLNDILKCCGTQEIPRFRIGIDPTPPRWDTADYVLGKFRSDERPPIDEAVAKTVKAVEAWCRNDLAYCMNNYN